MDRFEALVTRGSLQCQVAIKVARANLELSYQERDPKVALEQCLDACAALYRIRSHERKKLASSSTLVDKCLCQDISSAWQELGQQFEKINRQSEAKACFSQVKKWRHHQGGTQSSLHSSSSSISGSTINNDHSNNIKVRESIDDGRSSITNDSDSHTISRRSSIDRRSSVNTDTRSINEKNINSINTYGYGVESSPISPISSIFSIPSSSKDIAVLKSIQLSMYDIRSEIFNSDVLPTSEKCKLPEVDERLEDVQQLVHCLSLLPSAPLPMKSPHKEEQKWSIARSKDKDEMERLQSLASEMIAMFTSDGNIKAEATVAEVVCLAPVLSKVQFRKLMMALVDEIDRNLLLKTHLLEGLAQLMQSGLPGHIDSDDLVKILNMLSTRIQDTHIQSSEHLYSLAATVSNVLDAMVNNQVKGLKRERLHEPLAAYLETLRSCSDPHLQYYAAYAYQALLYIPDDETTMQAMLRRTTAVLRGVFGVVSAVKSFDMNRFLDEIGKIQEQLPPISSVVNASLRLYNGSVSLSESGETFMQCMKEGLSFKKKTAWYPALRMADALLQTGELPKFKILVRMAPCRFELAFQWGICQRLGQYAADTKRTMESRQDAIAFLGQLYKNSFDWGDYNHTKQWILAILKRLAQVSASSQQAAERLLSQLANDGDETNHKFYAMCMNETPCHHPIITSSQQSTSPSLLDRVQKKPDVEKSLRQLKRQQSEALHPDDRRIYIPLRAKASHRSKDDDFPLMDKVEEFLKSNRTVFLIQGDSGAGKSTFVRTLERRLWDKYEKDIGKIPLFISLPAIDNPERDLVAKQLRRADFTEPQIKELKMNRELILICDGYDETKLTSNLYMSNKLNEKGEWKVKMVISCRSEHLGQDYRDRFQPADRDQQTGDCLFQEAFITPFSNAQVDDYIVQYVKVVDPVWRVGDYRNALKQVPSLQGLVRNPFLLSLSLEVLPQMADPYRGSTEVKRVSLYDQYIQLWLERGKKRLNGTLKSKDRRTFEILCDEGFAQNGIRYLTALATAIYRNQGGSSVVDYSPFQDKGTWKEEFFNREDDKHLLREASPLIRIGNQFRFIHRSVLEYCLVRAIYEPRGAKDITAMNADDVVPTPSMRRGSISSVYSFESQDDELSVLHTQEPEPNEASPLVWKSFVNESSIMQFLVERTQLEPVFKRQLLGYIEHSRKDNKWRIAAANAMTILVRAGMSFGGADLRGIRIPGADLRHGNFDSAQLQEADLRRVKMANSWLREADLSGALMKGVQFGEWLYLEFDSSASGGTYSPDGKTLTVWTTNGMVNVFDTLTWNKLWSRNAASINGFNPYSPDSRYIALPTDNKEIHICEATSGKHILTLTGHLGRIRFLEYSPSGHQIASIAYDDDSVYVWDTSSGERLFNLKDHIQNVVFLAYSPDGKQLASAGEDGTIKLWDSSSGSSQLSLEGNENRVKHIAYSPDGREIISDGHGSILHAWDAQSGELKTAMRLDDYLNSFKFSFDRKLFVAREREKAYICDARTKAIIHTLEGHAHNILDAAFQPHGGQIATCSSDKTVRLWDVKSGQLINTFYGHTSTIDQVVFSPSGHQIASFSRDKTVRLWDAQLPSSVHATSGHTCLINSITSSPDGMQVASASDDGTVRLWDAQTGHIMQTLQGYQGGVLDVKYSQTGHLLASRDNSDALHLWDVYSSQLQILGRKDAQGHCISDMAFSSNGNFIVSGYKNGDVRIWESKTGQPFRILQNQCASVASVAFSPDGRQVASLTSRGKITVWSTERLEDPLHSIELGSHRSRHLMYLPNGHQIVTLCEKGMDGLYLFDTNDGQVRQMVEVQGSITAVAVSPCGRRIVCAYNRGDLAMVEVEEAEALKAQAGIRPKKLVRSHSGDVKVVAYSADGQFFASGGGEDKAVCVWDAESGQRLVAIQDSGLYISQVHSLAWFNTSEEGLLLAMGCKNGSVWMWSIHKNEGKCRYRLKWTSKHTLLNAKKTCLERVIGLSESNRKLLEQRGAIGKPMKTSEPNIRLEAVVTTEPKFRPLSPMAKINHEVSLKTIALPPELTQKQSTSITGMNGLDSKGSQRFVCSECHKTAGVMVHC
ncbi:hypothetical protein BX616_004051 [Lobosporangium transversale]|nr:hypothetical protein BX616_004051 [Lobosporangium transversale]